MVNYIYSLEFLILVCVCILKVFIGFLWNNIYLFFGWICQFLWYKIRFCRSQIVYFKMMTQKKVRKEYVFRKYWWKLLFRRWGLVMMSLSLLFQFRTIKRYSFKMFMVLRLRGLSERNRCIFLLLFFRVYSMVRVIFF